MGYPMVVIHFFYLRRVDNLSTVDKLAGPNVSFIQRFHCNARVHHIEQFTYLCPRIISCCGC